MLAFGVLLLAAAALAAPAEQVATLHDHQHQQQVGRNFPPSFQAAQTHAQSKPTDVQHHHQPQSGARHRQNVPNVESVASSRSARIIKQDMEVNPDGSHFNVWSSDNGIDVQEQSVVQQVEDVAVPVSQGEISYVDHEGNQYHLTYVADQFGFRAKGDHLPTPPPLPAGIARGLEYIKAHPYVEPETADHKASQNFHQEGRPVVVDN
ncbi:cuticular protein RR-1 family member 49 precursor [Nasonia vitripennis]|uniref:Uncharacterized protein n=1 Tax=Nasonia vitripennis TaxID=7425 RepID=A0A7M6UFK8_NASVI|nr:cuticular protein RR-1 family member 49 precursor [Nasonia vitripennis]